MNSEKKVGFFIDHIPYKWKNQSDPNEYIHISYQDIPLNNPIAHWFPARYTSFRGGRTAELVAFAMIEIAARPSDIIATYLVTLIGHLGAIIRYEGIYRDEDWTEPTEEKRDVGGLSPETETEEPSYPERVLPGGISYKGPMVLKKGDRVGIEFSSTRTPEFEILINNMRESFNGMNEKGMPPVYD